MLTELLIRDETTASLGKAQQTLTVHVSGETISQRVTQQMEKYNRRKPGGFRMLFQPHDCQIESLDTEVTFYPGTSITFLKFVLPVSG